MIRMDDVGDDGDDGGGDGKVIDGYEDIDH
jgi:hypothetical protein